MCVGERWESLGPAAPQRLIALAHLGVAKDFWTSLDPRFTVWTLSCPLRQSTTCAVHMAVLQHVCL